MNYHAANGAKGGAKRSARKAKAVRLNGRLGGRPRQPRSDAAWRRLGF